MENEKRLIDANALIRLCELFKKKGDPSEDCVTAMDLCIALFKQADTVDAVEVVRCKDCKNYGWEQEPCHGRTQRFCRLHKGLVVVDRETFCSYGERKGNGTREIG